MRPVRKLRGIGAPHREIPSAPLVMAALATPATLECVRIRDSIGQSHVCAPALTHRDGASTDLWFSADQRCHNSTLATRGIRDIPRLFVYPKDLHPVGIVARWTPPYQHGVEQARYWAAQDHYAYAEGQWKISLAPNARFGDWHTASEREIHERVPNTSY